MKRGCPRCGADVMPTAAHLRTSRCKHQARMRRHYQRIAEHDASLRWAEENNYVRSRYDDRAARRYGVTVARRRMLPPPAHRVARVGANPKLDKLEWVDLVPRAVEMARDLAGQLPSLNRRGGMAGAFLLDLGKRHQEVTGDLIRRAARDPQWGAALEAAYVVSGCTSFHDHARLGPVLMFLHATMRRHKRLYAELAEAAQGRP